MNRFFYTTVVVLMVIQLVSFADDWPGWLGEKRDGVWREDGIVDTIPEEGLNVVWRRKLGGGYSGPAVANGRVIVMDRSTRPYEPEKKPEGNVNFIRAEIPGDERVVCLRESDGEVLWTHAYACPYTTVYTYAIGPRCTPTIDGDLVYALGAEGNLVCLKAADGVPVWKRDFKKDYQLEIPEWGCAAHPLVDGDKLICVVGGKGTTVVAFNKKDGVELWRALDSNKPGYCAPVIYEIAGKRQLVIWHGEAVNGLNPETGEVYWSVPFKPAYGMAIGVPQLWKETNSLFLMGFNGVSGLISVTEKGAKLEWKGDYQVGIASVMATACLKDGYAYAGGRSGKFRCIKLEDGERMWTTTAPAVRGDDRPGAWPNVFIIPHAPSGRHFLANDLGDLILAELNPQGYREIGRAQIIEPTHKVGGRLLVWSHPAFANRRVYCRNDKEIVCVSLAAD